MAFLFSRSGHQNQAALIRLPVAVDHAASGDGFACNTPPAVSSDDAAIAEAEKRLSWLFKALQDYPTVSAWCGPSFEYDLRYHELLDVPGLDLPRAERLRRRSLVAMLMACLNALEEHYSMGLATDRARCLACLDALAPPDADEARLILIVRAAFEAVARRDALDDIDIFSIDRDARWVHARFVKNALDDLDAATGDPQSTNPPALADRFRGLR